MTTNRNPVGATDSPDEPHQYVVMDRQILEQLRDCYGDEFALAASGPDFIGAVAAVRTLHRPKDNDGPYESRIICAAGCTEYRWPCATIRALDKAGCP